MKTLLPQRFVKIGFAALMLASVSSFTAMSTQSVVAQSADNIAGKWFMNANGYQFSLIINQEGSDITGSMQPTNNDEPTTNIRGTVSGRKITFQRNAVDGSWRQQYTGWLFEKNRQGAAGTFSHNGMPEYGWYIKK